MRARGTVAAAAFMVAALLSLPAAQGARGNEFRAVADPLDRFTIKVPATWEVRTSRKEPSVEAKSSARAQGLPDTVQVIARDLAMRLSGEECISKAEWLMRFAGVEFKTVEKRPTKIAGLDAFGHEYTWRTRAGVGRRSYQVCLALDHRVFMLIGSTTDIPVLARARLQEIGGIIETFRPKASPAGGIGTSMADHGSGER